MEERKNLNSFKESTNIGILTIMLTNKCQMKCPYCAVDRKYHDMPEHIMKKSIDLLLTSPLKDAQLQFFGGEPLLRWDLIKKGINYSQKMSRKKQKNIRYFLTTNGLLLDELKISYLKQYPITVMFSLDGSSETQIKNRPLIKNSKYPIELLIKNLQSLIKHKIDYFVNLTFSPKNIKDLEKNIHYLINIGAKNILLSYTIGSYWPEKIIKSYLKLLKKFIKIQNLNLRNSTESSEPILGSPQILIDSSGKIYLGCAAVLEKTFPELNKSFYFNELIKVKEILALKRTKKDQVALLKKLSKKFNPKLQRMILNNLRFGELLNDFFKKECPVNKTNSVTS